MEVEVTGFGPRGIDRALLALKRKLVREGVFAALGRHVAFVKPSEARRKKRELSIKRRAKTEKRQQAASARSVSQ